MPATLFVMVGLPGAGKTTRARAIATEHRAVRFTPDEWMIPLFGDHDADGTRDVLEGRLIALARQLLSVQTNVILDFGVWSRNERSALRALAEEVGAICQLVSLSVEPHEQRRRLDARTVTEPDRTFEISDADLVEYAARFEVPAEDELDGASIGPPPDGHATWVEWAAQRWPTSMD